MGLLLALISITSLGFGLTANYIAIRTLLRSTRRD